MATDKDLTIGFKGEDKGLGAAARRATEELNHAKDAAREFSSAFTGGFLGAGVGGGIARAVDMVVDKFRELGREMKEVSRISREMQSNPFRVASTLENERVLGLNRGQLVGTAKTAEDAVSNALGGDSQLVRNFERLGISLKELRQLSDQPFAILDRLRRAAKGEVGPEQFFALENITGGRENALALTRTANSPLWALRATQFVARNISGPLGRMVGSQLGVDDEAINSTIAGAFDRRFNAPSTFAQRQSEEVRRRRGLNDEAEAQNAREGLSASGRLNEARKRLAKLIEQEGNETDPARREEIRTRRIRVEGEVGQLSRAGRTGFGQIGNLPFNVDQLQSVGAFVGGVSQTPIRLLEQQLVKLNDISTNTRAAKDAFEQFIM